MHVAFLTRERVKRGVSSGLIRVLDSPMPLDDGVVIHAIWALALVATVVALVVGRACMLSSRARKRSSTDADNDVRDMDEVANGAVGPRLPHVSLASAGQLTQYHDINDSLSCAHINASGKRCGAAPPLIDN